MHKFVFVVSHYGSNSDDYIKLLNNHPNIEIQNQENIYFNPLSLNKIFNMPHKLNNLSAIYGDHIRQNINLATKDLYSICKFIYFISRPKISLGKIKTFTSYESLVNYYCYRLRRIYEMILFSPGVLVTDETVESTLPTISKYLDLSTDLEYIPFQNEEGVEIPLNIINYCEERYEYYMYKIKKINQQ